MDSAAAWVSKSRDQQEARAERRREGKAERKRRPRARPKTAAEAQSSKFDEMDEESQVAGALVGHGADEFKAGESVVLTLADQQVVQTEANGYALNDGDEMLENVNMADDFRRNAAKKAATAGRCAARNSAARNSAARNSAAQFGAILRRPNPCLSGTIRTARTACRARTARACSASTTPREGARAEDAPPRRRGHGG